MHNMIVKRIINFMVTWPVVWMVPLMALLIYLPLAGYWAGLKGPFILDDFANIEPLQIPALNWDSYYNMVKSNSSGLLGRAVSVTSLGLTGHMSGMDVATFKYHNLMTHMVIALLLAWLGFRLLRQLLGRENSGRAALVAMVAALVWALHPLFASTVLYVVQHMAQLSMLFTIAGLLAYVIGRERLADGRRGGLALMIFGLAGFGLLAALSKENGVLLPLFILLVEWVIYGFRMPSAAAEKLLKNFHIIFIVAPLVLGGLYFLFVFDSLMSGYESRDFTLEQRVFTQAQVVVFYIYQLLVPRLEDMSLYQDGFALVQSFDLMTALSFALIIALVAVAVQFRKRAPVLALGVLWFFCGHLMESTVLPLELVFEHRNYLPGYGLVLVVCYYLTRVVGDGEVVKLYPYQLAVTVLIVGFLFLQTEQRSNTWSKFSSIVFHAYKHQPFSPRAASDTAVIQFESGFSDQARITLRQAFINFPERRLGTQIQTILSYCDDVGIPTALLEDTRRRFATDIPSPYVMAGYDRLQALVTQRRCKAFKPNYFILFTKAAMTNPLAKPGKSYHYWFSLFHANALMYIGQYTEAMAVYEAAYAAMGDKAGRDAVGLMVEKLRWQISVGKFEDAERELARMEEIDKQRTGSINYLIANMRAKLEAQKRHPERINKIIR